MSLSVGLGKIINDPEATLRTRRALGALSTPGLLVLDTGITIDSDGRLVLRLNPTGGLTQDETGLSVTGSPSLSGKGTASLSFAMNGSVQNLTIAVTGALSGDHVIVSPVGTPHATGIISWSGYVSAGNTVTIRVSTANVGGSDVRFWRAVVIRY